MKVIITLVTLSKCSVLCCWCWCCKGWQIQCQCAIPLILRNWKSLTYTIRRYPVGCRGIEVLEPQACFCFVLVLTLKITVHLWSILCLLTYFVWFDQLNKSSSYTKSPQVTFVLSPEICRYEELSNLSNASCWYYIHLRYTQYIFSWYLYIEPLSLIANINVYLGKLQVSLCLHLTIKNLQYNSDPLS